MKGKVTCQVYDSIDFDACKTDSDHSLLKPNFESVQPNGIVTAWKNNMASALVDEDWGWSTPAAQVCFESYNSTQMMADNASTVFITELSSQAKTSIELSNGTYYGHMFGTGAATVATNKITYIGYLNHVDVTWTSGTLGLLNGFANAGNGTTTWYETMATASLGSVDMDKHETLKVTWDITVTG